MIKIGLTGGRFSGKTEVCELFKNITIPVFDADVLVKFLLHYNFEINHNIRTAIGSKYFKSTDLDFPSIKRDSKFDDIVDIIETEIFNCWFKFIRKNKDAVYVIFKSTILFESGWSNKMDYNITVSSEDSFRINRAKEKLGIDYSDILNLISDEMSTVDKVKLSNFVIKNNGIGLRLFDEVNIIDSKIIDIYLLRDKTDRILTT